MTPTVRIDFISDISCPWCIIGLRALEQAVERLDGEVRVDWHFQPFELQPDMPRGGEKLTDLMQRKFGGSAQDALKKRSMIAERAAAEGFEMRLSETARVYNTFDAHRLLHWAGLEGRQHACKRALFDAHFTRGEAMDDPDVLVAVAERAGLDRDAARAVVTSNLYAQEVRADEALWRDRGIQSVPAIVIDEKYLISGGQPVETFEQALRQIAAEPAGALPN
ncbi:DsbA family oxidoreductase [Sphingobium sp. AN558]|uniref:DsbA family oxidoreductase n=1 Tax=Sphingobium sp. AN558 TaxID=3133442 RepID=UPI0030BA4A89